MIGTSYEMLLFITHKHESAAKLGVHPNKMVKMRTRIAAQNYTEDDVIRMLTKLNCVCIRERIVIPAIISDRGGRLYTEYNYIDKFFTKEMAEEITADREKTYIKLGMGQMMDRIVLRRLLRHTHGKMLYERVILPSIWSYEPIDLGYTDQLKVCVEKMLNV